MKTIVVSGACSGAGKTTLAREILGIIPGSQFVKIGHHPPREEASADRGYYLKGTAVDTILREHESARYLVIESNSILEQFTPDVLIFLDGKEMKPSAFLARRTAQIRSGELIDRSVLEQCAAVLEVNEEVVREIAWLAGARPERTSAIILAGGKSSRMGTEKSLLPVHGTTLVREIYNRLCGAFDEMLVSTRNDATVLVENVIHVSDVNHEIGPIEGVYRCIKESSSRLNFVIACDIPEVNIFLVRKLLCLARNAVMAAPVMAQNSVEPLFAVYTKDALPIIEQQIAAGRYGLQELARKCQTTKVEVDGGKWYWNINTREDYREYLDSRQ